MSIYSTIIDEPVLEEQSSSSFCGKSFEDDTLSSVNFMEQEQGPGISLNYSIEKGLEQQQQQTSPQKNNNKSSGRWYSAIMIANPRLRRRVVYLIGMMVFLGVILVVAISANASSKKTTKSSSLSAANTIQDSRFPNAGRGEGGGAGNGYGNGYGNPGFGQPQNNNVFLGDDVLIPPFSVLDPVEDLKRYGYDRPTSSSPNARLNPLMDHRNKNKKRALPTNAWYQNMLRLDVNQEPTKDHRVYTVPYIIDAAGDFAGIRAHATRVEATPTQVRLAIDEPYALTLGAMTDVVNVNNNGDNNAAPVLDKGYSVHEATDLGLTLQWNAYMKTTLVRGSPYVTMIYNMLDPSASEGVLPTMRWGLDTSELPIIDGSRTVDCQSEPVFTVERDLELAFHNSGQRWLVFFSRPVQLQCQDTLGGPIILQVLKGQDDYEDPLLVIRGALVVSSSSTGDDDEVFGENYANQLRASADVYPGQSTSVTHSFNDQSDRARISFHWDPQSMRTSNGNNGIVDQMISRRGNDKMIMFALPHHHEILSGDIVLPTLCTISLVGPVCLAKGNVWNMYEDLPAVDFQAPRHPDPKYVPVLAEALVEDIRYQIPSNFQSGAADTYFSGKTIAKLARILLITEEVKDLCASASSSGGINSSEYVEACDGLELPSNDEIDEALNQLRETVTVWVKTNAESPFVYDNAWGGLVSCGCMYDNGKCTNVFPECPAFTDQGLNFGNGFYNDHHFHYGYHIYAAAVLAHFDSDWAIDHYEDVTLLVRDYANPSDEDTAFPVFRNKDWYRGHSWASGLTEPMFGNIMNQESTSEAVMAYEAVALFGKAMTSVFQDAGDTDKASVAKMMHKIGLTLTATEIRSTQKYWQIQQNVDESEKRFPELYTASVVGILWETFVQFTTWFGNAPYLIYGIQLLPLTPISESRDGLKWAEEIYAPLAESCNGLCVSEGWSIQVNAILATIGHVQEAVEATLKVPSTAYLHAGGNGHSKSNTLWYISTRPTINTPSFNNQEDFVIITGEDVFVEIFDEVDDDNDNDDEESSGSNDNDIFDEIAAENNNPDNDNNVDKDEYAAVGLTCFNPTKCTDEVLNNDAEGHSCRDRIQYLMDALNKSEIDACRQVSVNEHPTQCGFCQPSP